MVGDVIGALTEMSKLMATLVGGVIFIGALACWPVTLPIFGVAYGVYRCSGWIKAKVKKELVVPSKFDADKYTEELYVDQPKMLFECETGSNPRKETK